MNLGRLAPDYSKPRLYLEDYKTTPVPIATFPQDRCTRVHFWPMYLNDSIGDCTVAGLAHSEGAWSMYAYDNELVFANGEIEKIYSAVSGYIPGDENTDNGANMQTVLDYWHTTGINTNDGNHRIAAYAQVVNDTDVNTLNWALKNFGSVYLGINCPQSAQTQFQNGPWTYVKGSPIIGGHAIVLQSMVAGPVPYNLITWGAVQPTDQSFIDHYVEEAWVALSYDWILKNGKVITGLNVSQLRADMATLGQ